MESSRHAVVVFDGECAFCNRWVDFLMRFDGREPENIPAIKSH